MIIQAKKQSIWGWLHPAKFHIAFPIAIFLFLAAGVAVAQNAEPPQSFLKGHAEHSEMLKPIARNALPGNVFTAALKKSLLGDSKLEKSQVPKWLSGTWDRTRSTELTRIKLPANIQIKPAGESVAKVTDKFGTFQDAQGRIWQVYDPQKAEGQVDRGNFVDYHLVSFYKLILDGPHCAVVEATATHLVVDKSSNKITSVYQDEEINTYTPLADGEVRTDGSVKVFDAYGKPIYLTKSVSMETRIAPFKNGSK